MKARIPELLAPAGSLDALLAALAAGADAVYTGLGALNARAAAHDLTEADLARACALAHARGARVYVTENVYLREGEAPRALALARAARDAGADALIVADAGLARLLREELPDLELHLSTQAGVMSARAALLAARELGAARVTCARELSVGALEALCASGVPVEAFCHGAICVSYSGACAFSALRRGRSANRGACTQPCRLPYRLEREGAPAPEAEALSSGRLLCPRDLLSLRHLPALVRAGVAALKIEGRMKNPDYVWNVVGCYRAALDALAEGGLGEEAEEEVAFRLGMSFNRGFTDAYLRSGSGPELMSPERAINQGVRVGEVVARARHEVTVALERPVGEGDTLEIRTVLPADAGVDVPARWPLVPCPADGAAGGRLRVRCKRRVEPGSAVYLTASARLRAAADEAVEGMRRELDRIELAEGRDGAAGARPAGAEGRPRASARAVAAGASPSSSSRGAAEEPSRPSRTAAARSPEPRPGRIHRVALAASPRQAARALADPRADEVAVSAWRLPDDAGWEGVLDRLTVVLDEPFPDADVPRVRGLCRRAASVVCRNLGQIDLAREEGAVFDVAAPVTAAHAASVSWLLSCGARRVWLPDELGADEASAVLVALPGRRAARVGVLACGVPQLMVCEHCLLGDLGPCDGACAACSRRRRAYRLVEEGGARLPVLADAFGRTRVLDDAPLDRTGDLPALAACGLGAAAVDAALLDAAAPALDAAVR